MIEGEIPERERIVGLARVIARRYIEEARFEGKPLPMVPRDVLVDREAARILRDIATEVAVEPGPRSG